MRSRSALPGRPSWVGRGGPFETDRSQRRHPQQGQFDGKSDPNETPLSQAGFDGDLDAGMLSWQEEILQTNGPSEEVPR